MAVEAKIKKKKEKKTHGRMEGDSLMPVHLRIETHKRRSERKKK